MREIFGWLDPGNREVLDRLIREKNIRTVLEIGTFLGQSAAWFAERVDRVICVDPFEGRAEEPKAFNIGDVLRDHGFPDPYYGLFRENMIDHNVWGKVTPVRGLSWDVAEFLAPVDLVYVDGDHSYEGCKRDIELYLPKARKVICGDDYGEREGFGVVQAVQEMLPGYKSHSFFWWFEK